MIWRVDHRPDKARALVRRPRIMILDDATSAVDPTIEAEILNGLRDAHDATLIVVAYRLSTITLADRVLVLDDGRIVATGTHDDLLATQPRYADIVRAYERGRNTGSHHGPPLVALRSYDMSWQIRSGAVNRATPDARSLAFYLYLPPVEVSERVQRAAAGRLGAEDLAARRPRAAGDLIAAASAFTVAGDIARVDDLDAADGFAWVFARASNVAKRASSRMSHVLLLATESLPKPTKTPDWRNFANGACP